LIEVDGLQTFSALVVPIGVARTRYEIIVNHLTR
jgi:hypothetical protein